MTGDAYRPQLDGWRGLSLAELNERAPLLVRQENKYLISTDRFDEILTGLSDEFDVLTIDDRTVFTYDTVYYDTDDLLVYHQHVQGKRLRLKIRSRHYVDTGPCFFEVKMKGTRGRTIKQRLSYDGGRHGAVDENAMEFVEGSVNSFYGDSFTDRIDPTLTMRYHRLTLVGRGRPERVTVDFDLEFSEPDGATAQMPAGDLIIEVKSENGRGLADAALRRAGARPAKCSKYCIGLILVHPDLRYNVFKRTLVRHFGWTPPAFGEESDRHRAPVSSEVAGV